MIPQSANSTPVCTCGSREFDTIRTGQNRFNKDFRLSCRRCRAVVAVGKSVYALYHYLNHYQPSAPFLRLFDLR